MRAELNGAFDFEALKKEFRAKDGRHVGSGRKSLDIVGEKKKFFKAFGQLREQSRLEVVREILEIDAKFIRVFSYDRLELSLDGAKLEDIMRLNR